MKDDGNIHTVQAMPIDHWGNWDVPGTPYRVRERCYEWQGTKFVMLSVESIGKRQVAATNDLQVHFRGQEIDAAMVRRVGAWLVNWWCSQTRQERGA